MANKELDKFSDDDLISALQGRVGKGNILALKVWVKEDIKCISKFEKLSDKNIQKIANYIGDVESLDECSDEEWDALESTVADACDTLGIKVKKRS